MKTFFTFAIAFFVFNATLSKSMLGREPTPTHAFDCVNFGRIARNYMEKQQDEGDDWKKEEKTHEIYDRIKGVAFVCHNVIDVDEVEYCYEVTQKLAKYARYLVEDLEEKDYERFENDRSEFYSWMKDAYTCDKFNP